MYSSCRVPAVPCDIVNNYDPKINDHIVVARKGKFYKLLTHHVDGKVLSESELEAQLDRIKEVADSTGFAPLPLGSLTSENRDRWAEVCTTCY